MVFTENALLAFPLKMKQDHTIEDLETEDFLTSVARPLIGKNPALRRVQFYTIYNPHFNAFAVEHGSWVHPMLMDSPCVFFYSGLIERETLGSVVLILFHELGHLAGKHMSHLKNALSNNRNNLGVALLGCLVGGVTGSVFPILAGMHLAGVQSTLARLRYSRGHESAADSFAFHQFKQLKWPISEGLDMMVRHASKENARYADQYFRSHPFFQDRMKASQHFFKNDAHKSYVFPEKMMRDFEKVKIKVIAFLGDLHKVNGAIEKAKVSEPIKNYGRAIAAYRHGNTEKALDFLAVFEKETGGETLYTCQLRSQILQSMGQHAQALKAINRALEFSPNRVALLIEKSAILLSLPQGFQKAIACLEPMIHSHSHNPMLWHWLGKAYSAAGNTGRMNICLAEHYAIMQEWNRAEHHIRAGVKALPSGDVYIQRSKDLMLHIREARKNEKK